MANCRRRCCVGAAFPQTVEAAYILAQEDLLEGLSLLKEECRVTARQQEVQIHSDMDQILRSRRQLEERVGGQVVALVPEGTTRCWSISRRNEQILELDLSWFFSLQPW